MRLTARGRLVLLLAGVALLVAVAVGVILSVGGGNDDAPPVAEAGSRFGGGGEPPRAKGNLLDALAPILQTDGRRGRGGASPLPRSTQALRRAPGDAVAGLFLVGFRGTKPTAQFFARLRERPYGGVLLTGENYIEPGQLATLAGQIQAVARESGHAAPLVVAEQGGGPANAFRNLPPRGETELAARGAAAVREDALAAARQLRALGIGVNLAPRADLAVAGGPAQSLAFSDDPGPATRMTRAAIAGYREGGTAAVVTHFPGEGAAAQDPDEGPAPVALTLDALRARDMKPFAAVARGPGAAPAIELSNAVYAAFDGVTPATLLPEVVKELRKRLQFRGAIVSGDLVGATATTGTTVGEAAVAALNAGCDLLLVPGGRAEQDQAFRAVSTAVRRGQVSADRVAEALRHIAALHRLGPAAPAQP